MSAQEENYAEQQAKSQLESIKEMVARLNSDNEEEQDEARQAIQEDALSVEVRSGWQTVGEKLTPKEFNILLCTGGPAVRILGRLDRFSEPNSDNISLQYQNWSTPWTDYRLTEDEKEILEKYCREFYFEISY